MGCRVSKWYLDLCTADGEGVIVYSARVHWGRLRVNYSALLAFDAEGRVQERMSLRGFQAPERRGEATYFQSRPLGCRGQWTPLRCQSPMEAAPVSMLKTPRGEVAWGLVSGRAAARFELPGRLLGSGGTSPRVLDGLGYVERLELTVSPWELPIEELHWGRFVSEASDAVWVEWRGPNPLKLVWRDGEAVQDAGVTFGEAATLRDGPLVKTVFPKVPVLRRALPIRMLNTQETKWRSRASVEVPKGDGGMSMSHGWAIHEVVRWG